MSLPPEMPDHRTGGDLAEYVALLRRRAVAFLLCLGAGVGGGLAVLLATPAAYTATAEVLVTPTGLAEQTNQVTARQREALNLDTEARIVRSTVVADRARALVASGGTAVPGARETDPEIEVTVPPNSAVLTISATAGDPDVAAVHAHAFAKAYLAFRAETARQAIDAQLAALAARLKQVNAALGRTAAALPGLAQGTAERALAVQRQSVLSRQTHSLTARYDALRTLAVTPGSLISEPVPPATPSAPGVPLHLGSGLMLGLLAGAATAVLRDRLDTRLRRPADVERPAGLPVLAEVTDGGAEPAVSAVSPRRSRSAERALRRTGGR
jgi:uncharacterized protein involved in exopolysaccharide biosynthesis